MIVGKDFLGKLRLYFGLNLYEVRIWTALLSRGVSSAGELSDIANVPRSRSYDILESLEHKGLIVQKSGKPLRYAALPPVEVVERVKKFMRIEAEKEGQEIERLKESDVFGELRELFDQGSELVDPHEFHGAMRGKHSIHDHLEHTMRKAQKTLMLATTETGLKEKHGRLKPALEELKRKGVEIRIAAPINKNTEEIVRDLSAIADVRHWDDPARFCVVDGEQVTFMVNHNDEVHPEFDVGIWAQSPFFSETLSNLFDLAWNDMSGPGQ